MPQEPWRPLSRREAGEPDDVLYEGVPDHLWSPLQDWLRDYLERRVELVRRVALRLRLELDARLHPASGLLAAVREEEEMLDLVDAVLHFDAALRYDVEMVGQVESPGGGWPDSFQDIEWPEAAAQARQVELLDRMLADAGSAFRVDWDERGLTRRVDATLAEAAQQAQDTAVGAGQETAAQLLAQAWRAAYQLHPEPAVAYERAVQAVEAAAAPVVAPRDGRPRLGKIADSLRDGGSKWELAVAWRHGDGLVGDVAPVEAMCRVLSQGQTSRHPGAEDYAPVMQAAAEAAVHLAVLLVQWFTAGAVRPRTSGTGAP